MNLRPLVNRYSNSNALGADVSARVVSLAKRASEVRGQFHIALSGGSLLDAVCPHLISRPLRDCIHWSAWHVFWADERCVPWSSAESNFGAATQKLFIAVDIPEAQIHAVDTTLRPSESARHYESTLAKVFQPMAGQMPRFDLMLLGVGDDGHTASLFPDHPLLYVSDRWAAPVYDAPKPPPVRITLTLPVINNARNVFFVVTGAEKADIVSKVLGPDSQGPKLPAQMVAPLDGQLQWFITDTAWNKIPDGRSEVSCR